MGDEKTDSQQTISGVFDKFVANFEHACQIRLSKLPVNWLPNPTPKFVEKQKESQFFYS